MSMAFNKFNGFIEPSYIEGYVAIAAYYYLNLSVCTVTVIS